MPVKFRGYTPSVCMAESPTNGCFATIAVTRPDRDMTLYVFQSCEAPSQALFREYGYFNLGHVQPTGVFRCVMPRDPLQKWCGSFWPEGFDQRLRVVGVEVIEDNMDTTGLGITIQEIAHEPGKVGPRAMFPRLHESPAPSRFHGHKNTACSATSIFVVLFGDLAGSGSLCGTSVVEQLIRLFVHANHRFRRIVRLFVLIQNVFHTLAKFLVQLRNTPRFFRHGFISWAFSHRLTSLLLTDATKPRLTAYSHRSSSVQRARPSGGSVQASATTCCFCRFVKSEGRPDRGASYSVPSKPLSQNRLRTSRTVRSAHPTCSTICKSVRPASDFRNPDKIS